MNSIKKSMLTLLSIFMSIIIFSCGAHHHLRENLIFKDTEFTYNRLKTEGMIIGGISSYEVDFDYLTRAKYNTILSEAVLEKFKNAEKMKIIKASQVVEKIGNDAYFKIMNNFDSQKTIKTESIRLFRDSIPDTKYMLFAYIENEDIINDSVEELVEDSEGHERIETEYQKNYLLAVEFQIFDIINEKLVWNNVIYDEAFKKDTRSEDTRCFQGCGDQLVNILILGEPAKITRKEVLVRIVQKLAEDLARI